MTRRLERLGWPHAASLLAVLAVHAALLYGLWTVRVNPYPAETVPLFVNLINPPPPAPKPAVIHPPRPPAEPPAKASTQPPTRPVRQDAARPIAPPHTHLAAEAPITSPTDRVEALPPPAPVAASPPAAAPLQAPSPRPEPAGPLSLTTELALVCPQRTPPAYPPLARRLGETGQVVLRVELDTTGRVSAAQVVSSSGFDRLDAAALAAVRTWRCQPALRDGQAVRSVALQPFKFTLD
ncbi:MAG: energy transducer TonB [Betaproteobacteria bacterium HGW-Betaproteobacteria-17]|nr:MAG: energy transducer TonB [Betaproteobacteria bacterium HGW-Betaproteobacteria-17]